MIKQIVWEHPEKKGEDRGRMGFIFVRTSNDNFQTPGTVGSRADGVLVTIRASAGQENSVVYLDNEDDLRLVRDALIRICQDKGIA